MEIVSDVLTEFTKRFVSEGINQMRETKDAWRANPDTLERSLKWTSGNTPSDALLIAPPLSRKVWYLSRRAQVVSFHYPRYDRLSEWREWLADVTANTDLALRRVVPDAVEAGFDALSTAQIEALSEKYGAGYLISRMVYPFPVIFETENYRVYRLK